MAKQEYDFTTAEGKMDFWLDHAGPLYAQWVELIDFMNHNPDQITVAHHQKWRRLQREIGSLHRVGKLIDTMRE